MPELPEVHTTTEGLKKKVLNLEISFVWTDYFKKTTDKKFDTIKNKSFFTKFKKELVGQKIIKCERRGKNILIHLTNNKTILIHMKMTGHLMYGKYIFKKDKWFAVEDGPLKDPFNQFIHFLIQFSNGKSLAFSDMRKFAKVTLFETEKRSDHKDLKILGPEPTEKTFDWKKLKERLLSKKQFPIKKALMDQTVLSGIGNIYSDEILWASSISPFKKAGDLKDSDFKNIYKNMIIILNKSIELGGDSMSDYRNIDGLRGGFQNVHNVYRKHKSICLKKSCGGTIERAVIGGRSCHFCNKHQV
jgi:formamidopyrimidine-DNA glycosylase